MDYLPLSYRVYIELLARLGVKHIGVYELNRGDI